MTRDKIQTLLSLGESQHVEFKSGHLNPEALGRVICGFLNTSGGYLVCGVADQGKVPGISMSKKEVAQLEKKLYEGLSPAALVSVQVQRLESKPVLVIEVPAGKDVPYAFRNMIYLRTGETTVKADAETIRDIVMRRQIEPERWERRFSFADPESDVAKKEIQAAVADAQKVGRAYFRDATQPIMVLEDFAAAKYGRLTNGGDVLFANNPAARLPQTRIRAMRYNTDKAGDQFSDMKSFEGPLKLIFEEAYSFIVRNTSTVSRFRPGNPKRQDAPLYPEAAVREALINALAHRDYSAASGGVSIHIFPRRLEIWNSGALPEGVTEAKLLSGHISVLRNPDIAHVLYLRGLMEKAGRGSVLMVKQCQEAGLPAPFWKSEPLLGVTVTFRTPEVTPDVAPEVTPDVAPEVTPEVLRMLGVLEREMSRAEIMQALDLKDEKHFRQHYQQTAVSSGFIEMTIPDKPKSSKQRYRLTALGKVVRANTTRDPS